MFLFRKCNIETHISRHVFIININTLNEFSQICWCLKYHIRTQLQSIQFVSNLLALGGRHLFCYLEMWAMTIVSPSPSLLFSFPVTAERWRDLNREMSKPWLTAQLNYCEIPGEPKSLGRTDCILLKSGMDIPMFLRPKLTVLKQTHEPGAKQNERGICQVN